MHTTVCIAQLNFIVGDLMGNAQKIIDAAHTAHAQGAQLLLTPELSICAYAAEDLFLRPSFIKACEDALLHVAKQTAHLSTLTLVVGHPRGGDERTKSVSIARRLNAASVIREGKILETYAKRELPNYQVFDEKRYFTTGQGVCVFEVGNINVGLLICEDAWFEEPAYLAKEAGAQVLAVLNASPFHINKSQDRIERMVERVHNTNLPLIYAHLVGGQDEVIFDGSSFVLDATGKLCGQASAFKEELFYIKFENSFSHDLQHSTIENTHKDTKMVISANIVSKQEPLEQLWHALVLGIRDYVRKNGFKGVLLGLSGGIDSALVLTLAVDALGKEKVRTVMMPSPYTAQISLDDAAQIAQNLGVRYDTIAIHSIFETFKTSLSNLFMGLPENTTEENIQARIRGTLLMALSNKFGDLLLTTGNKSEMATGYCTLYGDMAGGFAVIKDVLKTRVFDLCRWRNLNDPYHNGTHPIPQRIITRPPSAELRANQTDQDNLPPYEILDAILEAYMENDMSVHKIIEQGFDPQTVEKVTKLVKFNEFKRRQAPIGIRVTHRSFGKDWRYPITNHFKS